MSGSYTKQASIFMESNSRDCLFRSLSSGVGHAGLTEGLVVPILLALYNISFSAYSTNWTNFLCLCFSSSGPPCQPKFLSLPFEASLKSAFSPLVSSSCFLSWPTVRIVRVKWWLFSDQWVVCPLVFRLSTEKVCFLFSFGICLRTVLRRSRKGLWGWG